ncbi:MAG: SH3 domain-containing protein [Deltaproteobacteria bacterium]|nr:SH3 domain-containing protein [Deltaproteobacteria bacterium]MCX7952391.1 SH3 domain-containing protein [Deltaproteobacteria bacterium]
MDDERKKIFKLNLQDILGQNGNSNGEKTIHSDPQKFIEWFHESKLNPNFDTVSALLILEKHLNSENLETEIRNSLIEIKKELEEDINLAVDTNGSRSNKSERKSARTIIVVMSLILCLLLLIYLGNSSQEASDISSYRVSPPEFELSFQQKVPELKKMELDPVNALFFEANPEEKKVGQTTDQHQGPVEAKKNGSDIQSTSMGLNEVIKQKQENRLNKFPFEAEIIVNTPVLSSPSLEGEEVGYLMVGAIVLVVGESGSFYRISSKAGNDGYILKQDVGKKMTERQSTPNQDEPISPFSYEAVNPNRRN